MTLPSCVLLLFHDGGAGPRCAAALPLERGRRPGWVGPCHGPAIRLTGSSRCKGMESGYEERHRLESRPRVGVRFGQGSPCSALTTFFPPLTALLLQGP